MASQKNECMHVYKEMSIFTIYTLLIYWKWCSICSLFPSMFKCCGNSQKHIGHCRTSSSISAIEDFVDGISGSCSCSCSWFICVLWSIATISSSLKAASFIGSCFSSCWFTPFERSSASYLRYNVLYSWAPADNRSVKSWISRCKSF